MCPNSLCMGYSMLKGADSMGLRITMWRMVYKGECKCAVLGPPPDSMGVRVMVGLEYMRTSKVDVCVETNSCLLERGDI